MAIVPISLGSGSNNARFGAAGLTRHLNCYFESQGETKNNSIIVACDGLSSFATLENGGGIRNAIEVGAYSVVVAGRLVFRVDAGGGSTLLGGLATEGPVYMRTNRRDYPQVAILSQGLYYVIDTQTWTMTQVTDADLPPATSLAFLDGYGVLPTSHARWFITGLDDFTTIDPLDFAKAESDGEDIVTSNERDGEIVLFKRNVCEWWQDTGGASFPFTRSQVIHIGCLAAGTVCKVQRTLAWIDREGYVRLMQGYDGQRISDHGVERDIASVDPSIITSTSWSRGGNTFVTWTAPGYWTRSFNVTEGKWHDRESYGAKSWNVQHVWKFGNRNIAGDASSGTLYDMSPDYEDENGDQLVLGIYTPPVHAWPQRLQFNALFLDIIPGVGLNTTTPADLDPVLMISWTDNGGKTWSAERQITLGRLGEYTKRIVTRRLGTGTTVGRVFKITCSAAVAKALQGASVDVEKLAA
jgi:hypothetical protein